MMKEFEKSPHQKPSQELVIMIYKSSFDIKTPTDFFSKVVIPQYEEFVHDNSSSRKALMAIIAAYHMHEWVYGRKFEIGINTVAPDIEHLFEIARKITNATKHFKPKIDTEARVGFSADFSDDFARPLIVVPECGPELSIDAFLRDIVCYWKLEEAAGKF